MNRALALLVIGLVFGGGIGFVIAAANGVTLDGHDHATDHGQIAGHVGHAMDGVDQNGHVHSELIEVEGPAPTLMMHVTVDPVAGWNVHLTTTNFDFAPANSGAAYIPGQGHAHLYANGAKISRLYSNWFHIDHLPEGQVTLRATLNSNDHRTLAADGLPLEATIEIDNGSNQ